jgi:chemotaxis signal transduction protein
VGLLVSQVEEVVEVSPEEVLVKPLGMDAPFIAGVLRRKLSKREEGEEEKGKSSRLIFILKMDELFTEKELLHLKEIRERLEKEVSSGSRAKGSS